MWLEKVAITILGVRISPFVGALGITLTAACGGSNGQSSEAETSRLRDRPPAATVVEESAPRGGPVPPALRATWLFRSDTGPIRLQLSDDRYIISAGGSAQGDVVVRGNVISFYNSNAPSCPLRFPEGVGRYRLTVTSETLHLTPFGKDPCGGRAPALANVTFERAE